jgi:hypothetical protein
MFGLVLSWPPRKSDCAHALCARNSAATHLKIPVIFPCDTFTTLSMHKRPSIANMRFSKLAPEETASGTTPTA